MFKKYDAYLVGYYGMQNSGDDALMHASAWAAQALLGCNNIITGLYGEYTQNINQANKFRLHCPQQFKGQNRLLHYKAAIQSKRIIFGGGSVLHTDVDINLKRQMMMLSSAKESLAVGVGIGPFVDKKSEIACVSFLNECGYIGVRDEASFEIAKKIAPNANVHKTFDLAPLLMASPTFQTNTQQRKGIALSLCSVAIDPHGTTDDIEESDRINQIAKLITNLYQETRESIHLLELNGHSTLGDWSIIDRVLKLLPSNIPVSVQHYTEDPLTVLEDLSRYKAVLSMRLHGSILSYLADTPVISFNYHRKCNGWCDDIGLNKSYQVDVNNIDIPNIINQISTGLKDGFSKPALSLDNAFKQSLTNWSTSHA